MFFSLVVPVYKVEKYLVECLESIVSQSFKDYEIILVDDGSPDLCPTICDDYAKKYNNIIVLHKQNGGLSDARNTGISKCSGKYIVFIDSDDVICSFSLKEMFEKLKNNEPDVLISKMTNSISFAEFNKQTVVCDNPISDDKKVVFNYLFYKNSFSPASVQYIIKNDFIKKYNFQFEKGYIHEDFVWTPMILYHANSFAFFNENWYIRRLNNTESITNSNYYKGACDLIILVSKYITYFVNQDNYFSKTISIWMSNASMSYLLSYSHFTKQEKKQFIYLLKTKLYIFKSATGFKRKLFLFLIKILGLRLSLFLLSTFADE